MATTSGWRRRIAVVASASALGLVPMAAAHAATIVTLKHDAVGSSYIKKTKSTVELKATTLTTDLDIDTGDFTGSLPLPGTSTEFKAAGFLPVKANVDFIPAGPVTGHIDLTQTQAQVNATATYYVKLSNIRIVGFPTFTGSNCKTAAPVSIPVGTPADEGFDIIAGGNLTGTYTIGSFANCGLNTGLINALVPGGGNTVSIQASNGVVVE
ncbi:hypothetical protein AERO_01725 [Aeromicrobium fastidiosum]|uniref:hypothetical protein n=1 Tax=Aeromicrobium fastidiosum TaxID=52699 RepID=UPI0020234CEF|nr:hypothetical protein [Aeromicrobium fastidiosum]MCL8250089.1 hypothetical protein [Aeromicrobium fastidiosum]